MRVLLFGATGMVGQGVLRECLRAADGHAMLAVARNGATKAVLEARDIGAIASTEINDTVTRS
jgi:uncharacterized protein YbjT (DUF2867 family)